MDLFSLRLEFFFFFFFFLFQKAHIRGLVFKASSEPLQMRMVLWLWLHLQHRIIRGSIKSQDVRLYDTAVSS